MHLPNWLIYTLLALLLGVAPATSHLLGPSEDEAIQASALDKADAINDARFAQKE